MIHYLAWWRRGNIFRAGVPLHAPLASQEMFTDASTSGWGAHLGVLRAQGSWNQQEAVLHINLLEMKAVLNACKAFSRELSNSVTQVHIDNMSVVAYLKKEGGTHSWPLTKATRKVLEWCDSHRAVLLPVHISGYRNIHADSLSRAGQVQAGEWSMTRTEFDKICQTLGRPRIDLMATAENTRTAQFISPVPHQEAMGVDAFAVRWPAGQLLYAFPPPVLVPRVLQRFQSLPGIQLILVASMSPMRAFHPDLLNLARAAPVPVCREPGTLWQQIPGVDAIQWHQCPHLFQLGAWLL